MNKFITKALLMMAAGISFATISSAQAYNIQTHNATDWVGHTITNYTETVKLLKDDRFINPVQVFNITPEIIARVYSIHYTEKKTTDLPHKITYTFDHNCNIKFLLDTSDRITQAELSGSDLACEQVSQRLGLTPAHNNKD